MGDFLHNHNSLGFSTRLHFQDTHSAGLETGVLHTLR